MLHLRGHIDFAVTAQFCAVSSDVASFDAPPVMIDAVVPSEALRQPPNVMLV